MLRMNILEATLLHMSINLRGGNVGMAEHHLDRTQVSPVIEEVGGERVPKHMRKNSFDDASTYRSHPKDVPKTLSRHGLSPTSHKQGR